MATLKLLILAVFALGWTENVASENLLQLGKSMLKEAKASRLDAKRVAESVSKYFEDGNGSTMDENKRLELRDALKAVVKGNCSNSSLDQAALVAEILLKSHDLEPLFKPAGEYVSKCLTSDYLEQRLMDTEKEAIGSSLPDLVEKSSPGYRGYRYPVRVEYLNEDIVHFGRSEAIDLSAKILKVDSQKPENVMKYLGIVDNVGTFMREKILKPCEAFPSEKIGDIFNKIKMSDRLNDLGESLYVSLGWDTLMVILRRKFCRQVLDGVKSDEKEFVANVESKLRAAYW